eukprot:7388264-Prymnesium_polylepis.1
MVSTWASTLKVCSAVPRTARGSTAGRVGVAYQQGWTSRTTEVGGRYVTRGPTPLHSEGPPGHAVEGGATG